MVHDILPSDIELARSMLDRGLPDAEIQTYLTSRGVTQDQAAGLLADLHSGRSPHADFSFTPGANRATNKGAIPAPAEPQRRRHRHKHHQRGIPWWFLLIVVIFLLALGYAFFEAGNSLAIDREQQDKHAVPAELQKR